MRCDNIHEGRADGAVTCSMCKGEGEIISLWSTDPEGNRPLRCPECFGTGRVPRWFRRQKGRRRRDEAQGASGRQGRQEDVEGSDVGPGEPIGPTRKGWQEAVESIDIDLPDGPPTPSAETYTWSGREYRRSGSSPRSRESGKRRLDIFSIGIILLVVVGIIVLIWAFSREQSLSASSSSMPTATTFDTTMAMQSWSVRLSYSAS